MRNHPHYAEKIRNIGGAVTLVAFAGYLVWNASIEQHLKLLLLGTKTLFAAFLFLVRHPASERSSGPRQGIAYLSAGLPFLYSISDGHLWSLPPLFQNSAVFFMVAGDSLATWGLVSLGRSFGVTPAKREKIKHGAFRVLRHPIYLGYSISQIAFTLVYPSIWNIVLLASALVLLRVRARWEDDLHQEGMPEPHSLSDRGRLQFKNSIVLIAMAVTLLLLAPLGYLTFERRAENQMRENLIENLSYPLATGDLVSSVRSINALMGAMRWPCAIVESAINDTSATHQQRLLEAGDLLACGDHATLRNTKIDGSGGNFFVLRHPNPSTKTSQIIVLSSMAGLLAILSLILLPILYSHRGFITYLSQIESLTIQLSADREASARDKSKSLIPEVDRLADAIDRNVQDAIRRQDIEIRSAKINAKNEIALQVAHDLKTPLAALAAIRQSIVDPEIQGLLESTVSRIKRMTHEILPAKLPKGTEHPFPDLLKVVSCTVASLNGRSNAHIEISQTTEETTIPSPVFALLESTLQNLIVNGLEAAPQGVIDFLLTEIPGSRKIIFQILSPGARFPDEILNATQISSIRSNKPNGNGLGLAIVRRNLKKLGSALIMTNTAQGSVTRFSIDFSLILDSEFAARVAEA